MYQFFGKYQLAEAAFQKAIQIEPENIEYHYVLLQNYLKSGDMLQAKNYAQKIYQLFPDNPDRQNLFNFINSLSNE
jgi:tetratricopeptide (TPR) repeat protein